MAQHIHATTQFTNGFDGTLKLKDGEVSIGARDDQASPYTLLQGALIGCLHATFLDILTKKRESYESITYETSGTKRDGVPATIEQLHIDITVFNASKEVAITKSMELATRVCSVYQTISCVGTLSYTIHFK